MLENDTFWLFYIYIYTGYVNVSWWFFNILIFLLLLFAVKNVLYESWMLLWRVFGIYPCIEIIVILFLVSYQRFLIRRIIDSISLEKDIGIENRTLIRIDTSSWLLWYRISFECNQQYRLYEYINTNTLIQRCTIHVK